MHKFCTSTLPQDVLSSTVVTMDTKSCGVTKSETTPEGMVINDKNGNHHIIVQLFQEKKVDQENADFNASVSLINIL